ncbi:hypothetical protein GCM10010145_52030 [Streptomyces ruber]|uniref:Uncharacterized protein n=3 Tax=Streptomyces TaxID=1883 RepID=A0A918EVZ3_9ACTN|nr:hypothetical protein GCM10010145_52030 [Streptomyces ruber]
MCADTGTGKVERLRRGEVGILEPELRRNSCARDWTPGGWPSRGRGIVAAVRDLAEPAESPSERRGPSRTARSAPAARGSGERPRSFPVGRRG